VNEPGGFEENTATVLGRRVVAALEAREFDALAALFAPEYVEVIQRPGSVPVPRDEMLRGIRMLVETAGGTLTIDPIATLGDRLQLHHTRITVPSGDGEPSLVEYASVMVADGNGRLVRTEAFDVDRIDDARARLEELHRAGD
jgi:hypothetical protein